MSQFHFDPATYLELMRQEVPAYGRLQEALAAAGEDVAVTSVLDLGTGTGETLAAVLGPPPRGPGGGRRPERADARGGAGPAVGPAWLAELADPLPPGPFDLVVSALAVHHLEGVQKAALFARVAEALRPGGRFVLADVVVPVDPDDAITPLTSDHDRPSTAADQLRWLADAGFDAAESWCERDLVVLRADR